MAQSILIFDFGTNEEAAQLARHKVEAWQQGSRLGKKILLKFDREESSVGTNQGEVAASLEEPLAKATVKSNKKSVKANDAHPANSANGPSDDSSSAANVRLVIRLDFSDHEKLTQQRWLDRFAAEEPFKSTKGETIRQGNPAYARTSELFESLG
jgi:hypothetical protein